MTVAANGGTLPPLRTPEDGLSTAAGFVYVVAFLTLAAAVVAGIALILHKNSCQSNPFDSSVDFGCTGPAHPFRGAGTAILIGGVVQAGLWFVLARVTQELGKVRTAVRKLTAAN